MSNVDKIIDFCKKPNNCTTQCPPINASIGPYLHIIFNNYATNMRKPKRLTTFLLHETKTVTANNYAISNAYSFTNNCPVFNTTMTSNPGTVSYGTLVDYSISTYRNTFTDNRTLINNSGRMNS